MVKVRKLTRAEQKALRPTQILDAAFEQFVEQGYSAARVEDIADRVGVTKGTVYVYFPTKEELFAAMIHHISVPFEDMLGELRKHEGNCAERLRALILLAYSRMSEDRRIRELLRFVISEGTRFPDVIDAHMTEFIDPLLDHAQMIVDEGVAVGEFEAGPKAMARIIVAPAVAMIMEMLIHENRLDLAVPQYIEAHLDLVLSGLVVRPAHASLQTTSAM